MKRLLLCMAGILLEILCEHGGSKFQIEELKIAIAEYEKSEE